ncbi:hypothetical protein PRZ48_010582 [Zasmidium cellare]|uniref:DUF7371 domain-containing protein n=1 Tax=Zasmidium cellare TaxID=395010 RepID=A0ABR0E913_ZASCE|nr:hypothetical protein PRZ48_010582 [Zasmidium cellare]
MRLLAVAALATTASARLNSTFWNGTFTYAPNGYSPSGAIGNGIHPEATHSSSDMSTSSSQLWAAIDMGTSRKRKTPRNSSALHVVQSGTPNAKEEQNTRKDSALEVVRPPSTSKPPKHLFPEMAPSLERRPWIRARVYWHDLVPFTIFALLAFGAFYVLLDYLLSATRANATSCNATSLDTTVGTTIYAPTTVTLTTVVYKPFSSAEAAPAAASTSNPSPILSTTTIGYTVFTTVTVAPNSESATGVFPYVVNDGTTSWLNNMAPDSDKPLTTTVSSVEVVPVPATASDPDITTTIRSTSTTTSTTTVTPSADVSPMATFSAPPLSSTTFSYSPELTTTLFDTQYSTVTLSRVSSPTSFAGTNTGGWNATSSQPALEQTQPPPQPITTTETELVILNVSSTAATSTLYLTTTIGATVTQTILPSAVVSAAGGSTILTGEPVTLTHTVQSGQVLLSTSLTLEDISTASTSASSGNPANGPVSMTSTITAYGAPTTSPADESNAPINPAGASSTAASAGASGSSSSTTSPSSKGAAPWAIQTVTTVVSGRSTTLTVNSTSTRPTSLGFDSTSAPVSSASNRVVTITSFANGQGTTFTASASPSETIPMSPGFNTTTLSGQSSADSFSISTISSSQVISAAGATTSSVSSLTSSTGQRSPTSYPVVSTSTALISVVASSTASTSSHSTSAHVSTSSIAASNATSTSHATRTTSSSSFSNPFPPHSATATPSAGCGEQGNFTMDFDDLPRFEPNKRQSWNQTNGTDLGQYPPVTFVGRPYHHLYFSDGYVYAPAPAEPYTPVSSPNVAAFANPMRTGWNRNSTGKDNVEPGEFGGAFNDDSPAFWFDANTAYLGCDNPGPDDCTIEATAYAWNPQADDETPIAAQNYTIPACSQNCEMVEVAFPTTFRSLSGIQFRAIVDNEPRTFYVDDLNMRWSNSSCDAGMTRQKSR